MQSSKAEGSKGKRFEELVVYQRTRVVTCVSHFRQGGKDIFSEVLVRINVLERSLLEAH